MSAFFSVSYLTNSQDIARSRITDLEIIRVAGVDVLVSMTRFDGVLQRWDIGGATISSGAMLALDGGDVPGGAGSIMAIRTGNDPVLLVGGGADGTFQQVGLVSGQLRATADLPVLNGFQHGITVQQPDGTQIVVGGMAAAGGIATLRFDQGGHFLGHGAMTATAGPVTALAAAQGLVFAVDSGNNTLTGWQVGPSGNLTAMARLSPADGLWIAAPTALKVAEVYGVTYLILAAAGSSSLSVIEVGLAGNLIIRDHLLDTLSTRFAGVMALDVVTENDRTYVIAGGADDGLSVFVLLPGGQLVAMTHMEDTTSIGLDNVSAIAARGRQGGVDIYTASSSEAGVTQLRFDPGPVGVTDFAQAEGGVLTGTAGNDILLGGVGADRIIGGTGNDILRDGPGTDTMTGGPGADLFILTHDGDLDIITDFTLGEDRLDLSLWPMLRDVSQLTMNMTPTGFRIVYGDEELIVHSAGGAALDYRLLTNADVLGGMRLPVALMPGSAGPPTPPPSLAPSAPEPPVEQDGPYSLLAATGALAALNIADARSAVLGTSVPVAGVDRALIGTEQDDVLLGGTGDDLLIGRAGNDTLIGGAGADILIAGQGNNDLQGGEGDDLLIGGDGNDLLDGGAGDDQMIGGAGADTFIFTGGQDLIADFEQGIDRLVFGSEVWTGLTNVADLMFVYGSWDGSRATFDFGEGNILSVDGVTDYTTFGDDIALFWA